MLSPKQAEELLARALKWAEEQEKADKLNQKEPSESGDKPDQKNQPSEGKLEG